MRTSDVDTLAVTETDPATHLACEANETFGRFVVTEALPGAGHA